MHDAACLAVARRAVSLQSVYLLGALCRGLHDPLLLVQVEEKVRIDGGAHFEGSFEQ
jgi:hypothetical protein